MGCTRAIALVLVAAVLALLLAPLGHSIDPQSKAGDPCLSVAKHEALSSWNIQHRGFQGKERLSTRGFHNFTWLMSIMASVRYVSELGVATDFRVHPRSTKVRLVGTIVLLV